MSSNRGDALRSGGDDAFGCRVSQYNGSVLAILRDNYMARRRPGLVPEKLQ